MTPHSDVENKAEICRVTCGWRLPQLDLAKVRRFWRDVHSPAIARRAGIHEYRHMQYAPVSERVFAPVEGISYACDATAQLNWMSDVRYVDQAALDRFGGDPGPEVKAHLLSDIDMLVDRSTTYLAMGAGAHTFKDETGDPAPLGPAARPTLSLFIRQRGDTAAFRDALTDLSRRWSDDPGVLRVRLSLFEVPDMEAERKAGYPIKTHPLKQQYQAWIDLTVEDHAVCRGLVPPTLAAHVSEIHAYPVDHVYTFNYDGKPTLAGLRGYCAVEAIGFFDAEQHQQPSLLEWMYGSGAAGGRA